MREPGFTTEMVEDQQVEAPGIGAPQVALGPGTGFPEGVTRRAGRST